MKVHIDPVKCDGFGTCHEILPDVFLLDEWGYSYVIHDGELTAGQETRAREAATACPVQAISVQED